MFCGNIMPSTVCTSSYTSSTAFRVPIPAKQHICSRENGSNSSAAKVLQLIFLKEMEPEKCFPVYRKSLVQRRPSNTSRTSTLSANFEPLPKIEEETEADTISISPSSANLKIALCSQQISSY
uniref:Uncharacterized protein n=1 Tax=Ditylenchus dipsaci TaxID=166011 RepID=A0A915DJY8_9BILA